MNAQSGKTPLAEKVANGLTEEARCSILYELAKRVWNDFSIGNSPESILLLEDNRIFIAMPQNPNPANLAYSPPEVFSFSGAASSDMEQDSDGIPDKCGAWFQLGMLAYYLYYGTDFYTTKKTSAISFLKLCVQEKRAYIIDEADTTRIPFGAAVSHMTAIEPSKRSTGVREFLQYLIGRFPCTVELRFLCNNDIVGARQLRFGGRDIENLREIILNGVITREGIRYRLIDPIPQILYPPGQYRVDIPIERIDAASQEHVIQNDVPLYYLYVDLFCLTGLTQDLHNPEFILALYPTDSFCRLTDIKWEYLRQGEKGNRYLSLFLYLPNWECQGFLRFRAPAADGSYTVEILWTPTKNQIQADWFYPDGRFTGTREFLNLSRNLKEEDFDDWK